MEWRITACTTHGLELLKPGPIMVSRGRITAVVALGSRRGRQALDMLEMFFFKDNAGLMRTEHDRVCHLAAEY